MKEWVYAELTYSGNERFVTLRVAKVLDSLAEAL
jgi:hypothetical protein